MNAYEKLLTEFSEELIIDDSADLPTKLKGFYSSSGSYKLVLLNRNLKTANEKYCILAEEIGHYYTTAGDISDQSKIENRKQEEKARRWAAKRIASLKGFIDAFEAGCRTKEEYADHMDITEEFLTWSIDYYRKKYGLMTTMDKQYIIYFEPFGIMKLFEER